MTCEFEGEFTGEERRRIRQSLQRLTQVIRDVAGETKAHWRVREEVDLDGTRSYCALHKNSQVEFWGSSVDKLIRQVHQTADILAESD